MAPGKMLDFPADRNKAVMAGTAVAIPCHEAILREEPH